MYDNSNSGALFINDRKKTDKHPDMTGTINVDGKDYWISGWSKVAKSGKRQGQKFLSVSITPMEGNTVDVNAEIPF